MPAKPILDGVELQQVEGIEGYNKWDLKQHRVPALEGDFLQSLGRGAVRIRLQGVLTGTQAGQSLETIREKFRAAQPVSFVSDIATATKVVRVLVQDMKVRELAGRPERFEYAITLVEYIGPAAGTTATQSSPPATPPPVNSGSLSVEVAADGGGGFDARAVDLSIEGIRQPGRQFSQSLSNRSAHVWNEGGIPPGWYTVNAVSDVPPMAGSADVAVYNAQTSRVRVKLRSGVKIARAFVVHFAFGKAFVDPAMLSVLEQVVGYVQSHRNEMLAIVGHTDLSGSAPYNQLLSQRRARSVFACLTHERAEWDALRHTDSWGDREYQTMLLDLGYSAVEPFQRDRGLKVDGVVGDETWARLIRAYMSRISSAIPDNRIVTMAADKEGSRKWEGRGGEEPVRNTMDAWRPNRRTELILVRREDIDRAGEWLVQPAEPGTFVVRGSIRFEDGTPLGNTKYFLTAPDGECMDGERPRGPGRGRPIAATTAPDGTFAYPDRPKGIGIYTLKIETPLPTRLAGEAPLAARGSSVWKRLNGASDFHVLVARNSVKTVQMEATLKC